MALERIDIQALKKCNDVWFRYQDGKSTITAIKRASADSPFDEKRVVQCETRLDMYGLNSDGKMESAFEMIHASQFDVIWTTIVSLLKAGDELTLLWRAGAGTNENLRRAAMECDFLDLRIKRGEAVMQFHVDVSICPNNTARMCQVRRKAA